MNTKVNWKRFKLLWVAPILLLTLLTWQTWIYASDAQTPSLESLKEKLGENLIVSGNPAFKKPNILFNDSTNTIQISGQTEFDRECTFEARIYIPDDNDKVYNRGRIFFEYTAGKELKNFLAGEDGFNGESFPSPPQIGSLTGSMKIAVDRWHHIAFVQGGNSQRLYLNGELVFSRPVEPNTDIGDGKGTGYLGSFPSFIGHIDSFRLSNIARYRDRTFDPPMGKMQPDEHTVLLYNFELEDYFQRDIFTWIKDLSGNGLHGKFGSGSQQETPPSIVIPDKPSAFPTDVRHQASYLKLIILLLPILFGLGFYWRLSKS